MKLFMINHIFRLSTRKIEILYYYKIYGRTINEIPKGQLRSLSN